MKSCISHGHAPKVNLGVVDMEVLKVKLQGSSIWHNHVLEVTREGLRTQQRSLKAEKCRIKRDCAPLLKQQSKKNTG